MASVTQGVIVSKDGSLGFRFQEEGTLRVSGSAHERTFAIFGDDPGGPGHLVITLTPLGMPRTGHIERLALPRDESEVDRILLECALGELVDNVGDIIEKRPAKAVLCDYDLLTTLKARARVDEPVARHYVKSKVWWAWKLGMEPAMFYHADHLRFGALHSLGLPTVRRLARWRNDSPRAAGVRRRNPSRPTRRRPRSRSAGRRSRSFGEHSGAAVAHGRIGGRATYDRLSAHTARSYPTRPACLGWQVLA
jgi:hypothetical protein